MTAPRKPSQRKWPQLEAEAGAQVATDGRIPRQGCESQTGLKIEEICNEVTEIITENSLKINKIFDNSNITTDYLTVESILHDSSIKARETALNTADIAYSTTNESTILKLYKNFYRLKGIKLRTNRKLNSEIITRTGTVKYSRYVLRPITYEDKILLNEIDEKASIIPLDDYFGLNNYSFNIDPRAMLIIAFEGCKELSFEAAARSVEKILNEYISDETIRSVTDAIGKFVYNREIEKVNSTMNLYNSCKLKPYKNKVDNIIYIEIDRDIVNIRNKKGEKNDENKIIDENNQDIDSKIKGTPWRENKLGLVFSSDNMILKNKKDTQKDQKIKSLIDISTNNDDIDLDDEVNYILTKREYVGYIGSVDIFSKFLFDCALRNGYGKYKTTVLLSDGAPWIKKMKDIYFPDAIYVLNLYYLCKHIYDFAKKVYNNDNSKYVPWAKKAIYLFKKSEHDKIMPEIEEMQRKLPKNEFNLVVYIQNHKNNIDYRTYKRNGLYVGSCHIASENNTVLQDRLKRQGMRWNNDVAQHILTLITKIKSSLWEKDVYIPFLNHCYSRFNSISRLKL